MEHVFSRLIRFDPYRIFSGSARPPGLYARQKWLGEEGSLQWRNDFGITVESLLAGQDKDGSWNSSFFETVRRLFGLHLTLRERTPAIEGALQWLLRHRAPDDIKGGNSIPPPFLNGLPFIYGNENILRLSSALFLFTIFGLGETAPVRSLYEAVGKQVTNGVLQTATLADLSNILRAMAVHREYSRSGATLSILDTLASSQGRHGTWPGSVPLFQAVNALAHLENPLANKQLEKAFRFLAETQNQDGTWGIHDREWNTFLVVHALRNKKIL